MATKSSRRKSPTTFESLNPATGEVVGIFPLTTKDEVDEAVARARVAAERWSNLSFRARNIALRDWASILTRDINEAAELIHRETGKPLSDATLEVALAIEHIGRVPFGVVGVIGPWNYPIFTPVGSIAYALAAGNAVVFKPSEFTPAIGAFLEESWKRVAPFKDVLTVVTGDASTGAALTESAVDKISFTGSTRTAKKVAASCAERMIPVVLECGGKDAVIIDKDADIKKAAEMTLWHAMSNAGQSCIGAERVYVHRQVADQFKSEIVARAKELKHGFGEGAKYGPATMPSQLKVIKSHIDDAVSKGGTFLLGGRDAVKGGYVEPVILADVPEDSLAVTEETFGPTLVINTVSDMDEAVDLANATSYGLGAAVWSKKNGKRIATLLQCGMVSINSAFSFAAIGAVPFGGVKDSGYGRIHGAEGLLEFTYPRTVVKPRFRIPLEFTTFERSERADRILVKLVRLLHKRKIR
ncbi:MAG: aldehyde dehydrogenase family protein [Actinobacteria bacterium]|nr:aldehyde dehydrogenase family protein [Actinomycetota bacterium]